MANDLTDKPKADGETYDDRPFHSENLPPEVRAPLAPFEGAEPPSPKWFKDAIAQEPERGFVTSHGAKIEVLTWGERGKPGLLLIHGNSAHADWWSFIAPLLAKDFRVTAMSLAGMGASDWRETYRFTDYYRTIAFVNAIAWIANQQDHHPDLDVRYNRCGVAFSTHDAGGITLNDLICAARVDALGAA